MKKKIAGLVLLVLVMLLVGGGILLQKLVQNELLDMEADLKLLKQNLGAEGCRLPGKDEGGK